MADNQPINIQNSIEFVKIILEKEIDSVKTEIDLSTYFLQLIITESIEINYLIGTLLLYDKNKIMEYLKINGTELIILELVNRYTKKHFNIKFKIASIQYSAEPQQQSQYINLGIAQENYQNFLVEYSTSFNKTKQITDFVNEFSEKSLKQKIKNIEKSKYGENAITTFAFPYLKPVYIFNFLNRYIVSETGKTGYSYYACLCNSDCETETNYVSYDYMIHNKTDKPENIFKYNEILHNETTVTKSPNSFSVWKYVGNIDIGGAILERGFGSTINYFDSSTKKMITKEYTYKDYLKEKFFLGKYSLFPKDASKPNSFTFYDAFDSNISKNRIISNNIINGIEIQIEFDGVLGRKCGTVADFKFTDIHIVDKNYHPELSGRYLIKSITHDITRSEFKQTLNIIRNAYMIKSSTSQFEFSKDQTVIT